MISTVTTTPFAQSFASRSVGQVSSMKSNPQLRYFDNLGMKFRPSKGAYSKKTFEFSFDDMF